MNPSEGLRIGSAVPASNPFSSRYVRPGAIPYHFPPDLDAERLVRQLQANGWHGAVVGPHGTGKSSLLAALIPAIRQAHRQVHLIELHDGQRRLPVALRNVPELVPGALLVIDGYEQLSRWNRLRLKQWCASRNIGLLVTAHGPAGLPELYRTGVSLDLARQLVAHLLAGYTAVIAPSEIDAAFARHQDNLREMLFELYDLYEARRAEAESAGTVDPVG